MTYLVNLAFLVCSQDGLYLFGGEVHDTTLNDLWLFNTSTSRWTRLQPKHKEDDGPAAVSLHSANIIDTKMYLLLGRSSVYKYIEWVQEYDLGKSSLLT